MDEVENETQEDVTVTVTVPEPVVETPEAPTVVVVESAEPEAATEVVLETAIDHEGRLAVIESRLEALESQVATAAIDASVALDIATQEPEPEVIEVPIVEDTAPVEEDVSPDNEHPFFRKLGKWGL
jgi:hypothetical protein